MLAGWQTNSIGWPSVPVAPADHFTDVGVCGQRPFHTVYPLVGLLNGLGAMQKPIYRFCHCSLADGANKSQFLRM